MLNDAVHSPPDDGNDDNNLYVEHNGLLTNAVDLTLSPLSDQAFVDQTANAWAELRQEEDMYIEPSFEVGNEQFSQLLPWAINRACETFPLNTVLGGGQHLSQSFP